MARKHPGKIPSQGEARGGVAATAPPPAPSPWILDSWRDLLLFVATPLAILPIFYLAGQQWSFEEIALFVAAFGALGHHFPGMLRAYGDRELFERFKARFIVAPIFLAVVCAVFAVYKWSGMVLIAALWGVWHGLAQTYGFVRIYDAKKGSFAALTARLDLAMCVAWFGAGLLLSPTRMFDMLSRFYIQIGGPLIPAEIFVGLRTTWAWGTGAITVAFLANAFRQWRQGHPPSPIKLLLMATSFGFWWYTCVTIQNILVGVALFEIFHDVQYLSIVWMFNRSRVEKAQRLSGFLRFLFRRSGVLAGLYVGLVFAYGSLAYVAKGLPIEPLKEVLQGVLVASALLHFYFDGFIWKVRERSTRQSLGLKEGNEASAATRVGLPPWAMHGLKWAALALPIFWLGATEARTSQAAPRTDLENSRALAAVLPHSSAAQQQLGKSLAAVGQIDEAIAAYERSLALRPDNAEAHHDLSFAWAEKGDLAKEIEHLREAIRLKPNFPQALNNLAVALAMQGNYDGAASSYREVLRLEPENPRAHLGLGVVLATQGQREEGIAQIRQALAFEPNLSEAHLALAKLGIQ